MAVDFSKPRSRRVGRMTLTGTILLASLLIALCATATAARAKSPSAEDLASGIVRVRAIINPDGRTIATLGHARSGNGIVIDGAGLILTIGYLMVEAQIAEVETNDGRRVPAEIVGYDYDTGFGLLRATHPLNVRSVELGRSGDLKPGDNVIVARAGGISGLGPATLVAKREFAGYWEYLLEEALFTSPPYPDWSGAALLNRDGKLVGVGSLIVGDASGAGAGPAGNMFVPIDLLLPILGELVGNGRVSGPSRPWIGITTDEIGGRLVVRRVAPGGPAEKSGLRQGDVVTGIGGRKAAGLPALYRSLWSLGSAGVTVPLDIVRDGEPRTIEVKSIDRRRHLKLDPTL